LAVATDKAVLFEDIDGSRIELNLPLSSSIDLKSISGELEIPSYVDVSYFPVKRAIVTLWLSYNADRLSSLYPNVLKKNISKNPIQALLFGGVAVKLLCPSANEKSNPFFRAVKDADFIIPRKQGWPFYNLLLQMGDLVGTQYFHFVTPTDRMFNAWRHGDRYRIRTIDDLDEKGMPKVGVMDVFCDAVDLRHKVDVKEAFEEYKRNIYTIGLENFLLSKAQYIIEADKQQVLKLKDSTINERILPYSYQEDKVLVGMEEKDVKDVCAILLDHDVGPGLKVDTNKIALKLRKDKKFALTFRLNLENIALKPETLKRLGATERQISKIMEGVQSILRAVPPISKRWDKPWWNTAVESVTA
jgi:hypothetical protein